MVAAYFSDAGTETSSRPLLDMMTLNGQAELFADLRGTSTNAAALCGTLVEVFDEWPGGEADGHGGDGAGAARRQA